MRALVSSTLLAWAALASAATPPAPGQIESAADVTLTNSSSMVSPKTEIASVKEKSDSSGRRLWLASICAVVVASSFDAATSWGKYEANSVLASSDGRFGAKGVSIKAAIAGAGLLPQLLLRHHKDFRTTFTIANFAEAAIYTGVSVHNLGIPAAKP